MIKKTRTKNICTKIIFSKIIFSKLFFRWLFFEKFRNSIGIATIPFITRYKENQWSPYIKSRKFWISENFENFGHLVTNWSPSSDTFFMSSFLWVHSLIICYNKKIVSRVRAMFFLRFLSKLIFRNGFFRNHVPPTWRAWPTGSRVDRKTIMF